MTHPPTQRQREQHLEGVTVALSTKLRNGSTYSGTGVAVAPMSKDAQVVYVITALHCLYGSGTAAGDYPDSRLEILKITVEPLGTDGALCGSCFEVSADSLIELRGDAAVLRYEPPQPKLPRVKLCRTIPDSPAGYLTMGFPQSRGGAPMLLEFEHQYGVDKTEIQVRCTTPLGDAPDDDYCGLSGSGVFDRDSLELVGVVTSAFVSPSGASQGNLVKVTRLSATDINRELAKRDLPLLAGERGERYATAPEGDALINFERFELGDITINLWQAVNHLKNDLKDDWFRDPLGYKDLLTTRVAAKLLEKHRGHGTTEYKARSSVVFQVPKKGYTTRRAVVSDFADRVVYQALVGTFADAVDAALLPNVYSFRYNTVHQTQHMHFFHYSVEQWKKFQVQIASTISDVLPVLLCTDISHFFDHIHIESLGNAISETVEQGCDPPRPEAERAIQATVRLLKASVSNSETHLAGIGLPQNRDASSVLANAFLRGVDQKMTIPYKYYRFMDDIRVGCATEEEARRAIQTLSSELNKVGLALNDAKTFILHKTKNAAQLQQYLPQYEARLEQIDYLLQSGRARGAQLGMQLTIELFYATLEHGETGDGMRERKLAFCIARLARFARQPLLATLIDWEQIATRVIPELRTQPWATDSIVALLTAIDTIVLTSDHYSALTKLVAVPPDKVTYDWQAYHIWLLLAYHRHDRADLRGTAIGLVQNPVASHLPLTAGAAIYCASIDHDKYAPEVLNSLNAGFFRDYLTQRAAVIALRNTPPSKLVFAELSETLRTAHAALYEQKPSDEYVVGLPKIKLKHILRDLPSVISPSVF